MQAVKSPFNLFSLELRVFLSIKVNSLYTISQNDKEISRIIEFDGR